MARNDLQIVWCADPLNKMGAGPLGCIWTWDGGTWGIFDSPLDWEGPTPPERGLWLLDGEKLRRLTEVELSAFSQDCLWSTRRE